MVRVKVKFLPEPIEVPEDEAEVLRGEGLLEELNEEPQKKKAGDK